jgi:choline dehydrogenase-like flavoprotein
LPPLPLRPADRILMKAVTRFRDVSLRAVPIRRAIETRPEHDQRCRGCGECIFGCTAGSVYKFSSRLLPRIAGRSNYRLLCGVKVRRLIRDADTNRITAAECIDADTGRSLRIEADNFILCCGALETPRVLFNSRDEAYPGGLSNSTGLVGCYLQDKVKTVLGTSLLRLFGSKKRYAAGSNDAMMIPRFLFDNRGFRGGFMYNFSHFLPRRPYYLEGLDFLPGRLKPFFARMLFRSYVALMCFGKAEARRGNRVVPSQQRDRFGVPQVDVEYAFSDNDRRMQHGMIEYGRRILRKCSGLIVKVYAEPLPGRSIHYAGTCRMAAAPAQGVVDVNLRSFDHPNLYLCDGSVVPEVTEKNVTLTIMALADRLADFLKEPRTR